MNVIYSKYNTKVIDSYKEKDIPARVDEIIEERNRRGYPVTRSKASYVSEWKAHNRLYWLHIERSHTKDVDMEEFIDKCKDIGYKILGI